MSLRRFLLLPLMVSLSLFVYYSSEVRGSFDTLISKVHITYHLLVVLVLATLLQLIGHIIRAHKARLLLQPVKESSTRFQFRALSIGYLFNTILPFRLGELVRARVIAGAMTISFSLAFVFIIFERAIDALILGIIGLLIRPTINYRIYPQFRLYAVFLIVLALVIFGLLRLLVKENKYLLKACYHLTSLLNDNLKHSFRFKSWTIIYGLQQILTWRKILRYLKLSLASWVFYGASTFVVVQYLLTYTSIIHKLVLAIAPYYGVAIPSGPANLGIFSHATDTVTKFLHLDSTHTLLFNLLSWAVLVLPVAIVGFVLLLVKTKESFWGAHPRKASMISLSNKLHRDEDISYEMASFLENYFSGNSLSKIVHRLERQDNFRLLKYFKGGSDAITILALHNGQKIVKKIISLEFEDRLRAQHDWLVDLSKAKGIVNVLGQEKTDDYYSIDLEFRDEDVMFFEYIHRHPVKNSERVMDKVWRDLMENVHNKQKWVKGRDEDLNAYLAKHLYGCFEKAALVEPELIKAADTPTIIINGNTYDNFFEVLEKIKKNKQAWRDLSSFKETKLTHGDVIVDNLLVNSETDEPLLIDPAPDGNLMNGPVFDFGKNLQSLYAGYEFLIRDECPTYFIDGVINYDDHTSVQYTELCAYLRNVVMPKYLTEGEQKAALFHGGALYIRRLKHQVYYTPANVLKFYAVGVKMLNDFLDQYED